MDYFGFRSRFDREVIGIIAENPIPTNAPYLLDRLQSIYYNHDDLEAAIWDSISYLEADAVITGFPTPPYSYILTPYGWSLYREAILPFPASLLLRLWHWFERWLNDRGIFI